MTLSDEQIAELRRYFDVGAYYYSFESTGDEAIDLVLAAVCRAGKEHHHTDAWAEHSPYNRDVSPVDYIQAAANRAAEARRARTLDPEDVEALENARLFFVVARNHAKAPKGVETALHCLAVIDKVLGWTKKA